MQFDEAGAVQLTTPAVSAEKLGLADVRKSCSTAATSAAANVTAPVRVLKLVTPPPPDPHPEQLATVSAPPALRPYAPLSTVTPSVNASDCALNATGAVALKETSECG